MVIPPATQCCCIFDPGHIKSSEWQVGLRTSIDEVFLPGHLVGIDSREWNPSAEDAVLHSANGPSRQLF
jgi:hypothetical protein